MATFHVGEHGLFPSPCQLPLLYPDSPGRPSHLRQPPSKLSWTGIQVWVPSTYSGHVFISYDGLCKLLKHNCRPSTPVRLLRSLFARNPRQYARAGVRVFVCSLARVSSSDLRVSAPPVNRIRGGREDSRHFTGDAEARRIRRRRERQGGSAKAAVDRHPLDWFS